jgi:hypothetical protein
MRNKLVSGAPNALPAYRVSTRFINKLDSGAPAGCFAKVKSAKFGKQVNPMLQNA